MATPRDIGVDVIAPEADWDGSENCPFYGSLRVRGQIIEGIVSSLGMNDSIVVERQRIRSMKKYERYEKKTNRFNAHYHLVGRFPSEIGFELWNVALIEDSFILCN